MNPAIEYFFDSFEGKVWMSDNGQKTFTELSDTEMPDTRAASQMVTFTKLADDDERITPEARERAECYAEFNAEDAAEFPDPPDPDDRAGCRKCSAKVSDAAYADNDGLCETCSEAELQ